MVGNFLNSSVNYSGKSGVVGTAGATYLYGLLPVSPLIPNDFFTGFAGDLGTGEVVLDFF